jgi:hypothetical protein
MAKREWMRPVDYANVYNIPRTNVSMLCYYNKHKDFIKPGFIDHNYMIRLNKFKHKLKTRQYELYYEILEYTVTYRLAKEVCKRLKTDNLSSMTTYFNNSMWRAQDISVTKSKLAPLLIPTTRVMRAILSDIKSGKLAL